MANPAWNPRIFMPRGSSKTNIEELIRNYTYYSFTTYPYRELNMSVFKTDLINRLDNRMSAHPFPKGSGFSSLSDMISTLNQVADYNADLTPDNIIRLAAKIDHLDKINKDIVYDNMNVFMGLMYYKTQYNSNSNSPSLVNTLLKQLYVAQVYYRHCGYNDIKLQPQGKRNIRLHDDIKRLLKLNDKYRGVTR